MKERQHNSEMEVLSILAGILFVALVLIALAVANPE